MFQFVVIGGNKQTIPFRRQRLDIDCMLAEPSPKADTFKYPNGNDPYLIDMIQLADERIIQLQTESEKANQSVEILETKLSNYKNQVIYHLKYTIYLIVQ
jgi:centrosomal protein CEP135